MNRFPYYSAAQIKDYERSLGTGVGLIFKNSFEQHDQIVDWINNSEFRDTVRVVAYKTQRNRIHPFIINEFCGGLSPKNLEECVFIFINNQYTNPYTKDNPYTEESKLAQMKSSFAPK